MLKAKYICRHNTGKRVPVRFGLPCKDRFRLDEVDIQSKIDLRYMPITTLAVGDQYRGLLSILGVLVVRWVTCGPEWWDLNPE